MDLSLPKTISLMEVGPRDGLQNEKAFVPTFEKIEFIEALASSGIRRIEATAFVSPRYIPPLSDQMEVMRGIKKRSGAIYAALVPNFLGYERAIKSGADEISIVIAVTNSHNQKNLNADTETVFSRYKEVSTMAKRDKIPFRAYLSCTFGCPYEGDISLGRVVDLIGRLLSLGAYEVSLSDTIGIASPLKTKEVLDAVLKKFPSDLLALHMHDTRGMALANIFLALSMGIHSFDSAAGGLGGCPYAPGASGNVATEDFLNMLHSMGIDTGIDIDQVIKASLKIEGRIKKHVPSKLAAIKRARENLSE